MTDAKPQSPSIPTAMQGFALVRSLVADWEPPTLPDSALEIAVQEWEHFHDTLLSHVDGHRPGKCAGLTLGKPCDLCRQIYKDPYVGIDLKNELLSFQVLDQLTLMTDEGGEHDDGFDPDEYNHENDPFYTYGF